MKYNQPYGVGDVNASYLNGNPATGTMGSIPPAESIEYPQREIVNLITDAGFSPTNTDLHQVAKAIQSSKLIYAADAGTANAYNISVVPALTSYAVGQRWSFKALFQNTGPATLNVSARGARAIVYPNGTPLKGNEILPGAVVTVIDDGTRFQLQNVASNFLAAPLIYYVNSTTGSDVLYNGTSPTVSGVNGPFATHNRAIAAAQAWNQNGFNVTINTADGTYPPIIPQGGPNGSGYINIVGNVANPTAVLIHATVDEAIFFTANGYGLNGLRVQSDSVSASPKTSSGIRLLSAALSCRNIDFGACAQYHMYVDASSRLSYAGVDVNDPTALVRVSGNAGLAHINTAANSLVHFAGPALTLVGSRTANWIVCATAAVAAVRYSSITGPAVTGQRYSAFGNGVIGSSGNGTSYYPGSIAGALATGGQYL